jgi:hypothetical protein
VKVVEEAGDRQHWFIRVGHVFCIRPEWKDKYVSVVGELVCAES